MTEVCILPDIDPPIIPRRMRLTREIALVTADAVSREILDSELARDITRSLEHIPLEGGLEIFRQS